MSDMPPIAADLQVQPTDWSWSFNFDDQLNVWLWVRTRDGQQAWRFQVDDWPQFELAVVGMGKALRFELAERAALEAAAQDDEAISP